MKIWHNLVVSFESVLNIILFFWLVALGFKNLFIFI